MLHLLGETSKHIKTYLVALKCFRICRETSFVPAWDEDFVSATMFHCIFALHQFKSMS